MKLLNPKKLVSKNNVCQSFCFVVSRLKNNRFYHANVTLRAAEKYLCTLMMMMVKNNYSATIYIGKHLMNKMRNRKLMIDKQSNYSRLINNIQIKPTRNNIIAVQANSIQHTPLLLALN